MKRNKKYQKLFWNISEEKFPLKNYLKSNLTNKKILILKNSTVTFLYIFFNAEKNL